jgi:hypothetical protein
MDLKETGNERVNCVYLAEDSDQWRVLVYLVMNFRVSEKVEEFLDQLSYY